MGATPRFVDVDEGTALVTAAQVAPAIGPRTRAVMPGAPVRAHGRPRADRGARAPRRHRGDRGRLPGPRRVGGARAPRRLGRRLRRVLLLPREEPRGVGRRRRARDERRHDRRARPAAALARRAARATTTSCPARRPGSTRSRPRCCGSSCGASTCGTPRGGGSRPRSRTRWPAPRSSAPVAVAGGDHVYHQFVVRSTERDALRQHLGRGGHLDRRALPGRDPPLAGLPVGRPRAALAARRRGVGVDGRARCRCTRC